MGERGPVAQPEHHGTRPQPREYPEVQLDEIPAAPENTGSEALAVWESFWRSHAARYADPTIDLPALRRWIWLVEEWHRVAEDVRRNRLVPGSTGEPRLNPLYAYLATLGMRSRPSRPGSA